MLPSADLCAKAMSSFAVHFVTCAGSCRQHVDSTFVSHIACDSCIRCQLCIRLVDLSVFDTGVLAARAWLGMK